jgi:hypothetical protein
MGSNMRKASLYMSAGLFLSLLFTVSCDMNKVENIVLLRADAFSGETPDYVRKWVIISDRNGRVLDYMETTNATGVLGFEGDGGEWITVTELSISTFEQGSNTLQQYTLSSYMGVPTGNSYFVAEPDNNSSPYPDPVGNAKLTVLNYSGSDDPYFSIGFSDSYMAFNTWLNFDTWNYDGSTYAGEVELREDPLDILISTYEGLEPRYTWVRDVGVGDSVVVDVNSFEPMIPVTINKPVQNAYIQGQIEPTLGGKGYELSRSDYWRFSDVYDPNQIPELGYIDGFETYDVYASGGPVLCCEPHERVTYHKLGSSVPQSIILPDYSVTLQINNAFDPGYTFDGNYTYKKMFGTIEEENNIFLWFVNAPQGTEFVKPRIPNEIAAEYPFLNIDQVPIRSMSFVESLDDFSYLDFVRRYYERQSGRTEFEEIRYYAQF